MIKNRSLSHSIFYASWGKFTTMLKQKAVEYDTEIYEVGRFFSSSKLCSSCGQLKDKLDLSQRVYECECGLKIDRDINAAINLRNDFLREKSSEYGDHRHGEIVRPLELCFDFSGSFDEVSTRRVA